MDPEASPSAITFYITSSAGETLLYMDENRQVKPWLAQSWEVSDNGKTFTFKLRNDVTFQDETPFMAAAVKWNLDRVVDPSYKAGSALAQLTGYQGTDVVDEFTARVRIKDPFVPFLIYSGSPYMPMLSPTATQKQGDQVNQMPVMSGPYKVDEWVAKDPPHALALGWLQAPRAVVRPRRAGLPRQSHLEVHPVGRYARRHRRIGRDADGHGADSAGPAAAASRRGCRSPPSRGSECRS